MFSLVSSVLGFTVLTVRSIQIWRARPVLPDMNEVGLVSILVPARNEERNLPMLLKSLAALRDVQTEVIVVDDGSRDRTAEIAETFAQADSRFKLVRALPRPEGWSGKNWACHQGAEAAKGEWFLFTDADTFHRPRGLSSALAFLKAGGHDLCSAIPFHRSETLWEKLLGPFHFFVLVSAAAFSRPKRKQLFAIGQYLLFKRERYFAQGGHEAIRASLADDLDLANACLNSGGSYGVEKSAQIFEVRMYLSFREFILGWRRIFRLGFAHANLARVAEIYFLIACFMMSFQFRAASQIEVALSVASVLVLAIVQRRFGRFSILGALMAPFGIGLFVMVTLWSVCDQLFRRDLKWRGRAYKSTVAQRH